MAYWLENGDIDEYRKDVSCSVCGMHGDITAYGWNNPLKYCPNCGTKMDGIATLEDRVCKGITLWSASTHNKPIYDYLKMTQSEWTYFVEFGTVSSGYSRRLGGRSLPDYVKSEEKVCIQF